MPLPGRYVTIQRYRESRELGKPRTFTMGISEVDIIAAEKRHTSAADKISWTATMSSVLDDDVGRHGPQTAIDGQLTGSWVGAAHHKFDDIYTWLQVCTKSSPCLEQYLYMYGSSTTCIHSPKYVLYISEFCNVGPPIIETAAANTYRSTSVAPRPSQACGCMAGPTVAPT